MAVVSTSFDSQAYKILEKDDPMLNSEANSWLLPIKDKDIWVCITFVLYGFRRCIRSRKLHSGQLKRSI